MMKRSVLIVTTLCLAGCSSRPSELGREPVLTPVGAGMVPSAVAHEFPGYEKPPTAFNSLYHDGESLYRDPRAMKPGDVLTINISINDKASVGNNTDRKLEGTVKNSWSMGTSGTGTFSGNFNTDSSSEANGTGNIDRSEKIQVSVAAVVTRILPDGNLLVSGSQEIRVNYEMRQVYVAGIVRPRDISKDNTISYEKIAEARISYGGRGRLMEVQQPAVGQQIYDAIKPF
jgi:flagellar L-ring protein precursor FlgH